MTDGPDPGRLPVGHVVLRRLLAGLVIALVATAVIAAVLHRASELAFGQMAWNAVKHWALPW